MRTRDYLLWLEGAYGVQAGLAAEDSERRGHAQTYRTIAAAIRICRQDKLIGVGVGNLVRVLESYHAACDNRPELAAICLGAVLAVRALQGGER